MAFEIKEDYNIQDLVELVQKLRSPEGCPWDREQTHASIRKSLLEETYEVAEAIDAKDTALLREELGDLLLQILLHSEIEHEAKNFSFNDVCNDLCKKLVYRHPHVFGKSKASKPEDALKTWEEQKNTEKGRKTAADQLGSVPITLPALMKAAKVQKRAAKFGFTYKDVNDAMKDLGSEIQELKQALLSGENVAEELGDVIFSAVNVSRYIKADAEEELSRATHRFSTRVQAVERFAEEKELLIENLSSQQLDIFWKHAKEQE